MLPYLIKNKNIFPLKSHPSFILLIRMDPVHGLYLVERLKHYSPLNGLKVVDNLISVPLENIVNYASAWSRFSLNI